MPQKHDVRCMERRGNHATLLCTCGVSEPEWTRFLASRRRTAR